MIRLLNEVLLRTYGCYVKQRSPTPFPFVALLPKPWPRAAARLPETTLRHRIRHSATSQTLGTPWSRTDGPVDGADCQGGTDMSVHLKTLGVEQGWRLMVWDDTETSLIVRGMEYLANPWTTLQRCQDAVLHWFACRDRWMSRVNRRRASARHYADFEHLKTRSISPMLQTGQETIPFGPRTATGASEEFWMMDMPGNDRLESRLSRENLVLRTCCRPYVVLVRTTMV